MSKAKAENRAKPKRFYDVAMAAPSGDGFAITLDGKQVKTPARNVLIVRDKKLAEAVAEEWRAQKEFIDAETMPLTRLSSLTLDRASQDREAWIADIVRYAETDLVCYHAPDAELGRAQHAAFLPLLGWVEQAYGMQFEMTESLTPIEQPAATLQNARVLVGQASDAELAALAMMVPLLGSYVLAIALWKERITPDQAIAAARLDETHHAKKWGEDEEAAQAWAAKEKDIRACALLLSVMGNNPQIS